MQNVIQHPQVAPTVPEPQTTPIMPAATSIPQTASPEGRCREVHRVAGELFQRSPDWVTFFREVLGVEGAARRIFPSSEEFMQFEQTQEYNEIQQMVAKLRENSRSQAQGTEPTRVITVRLPKSLHESLRTEAHERRTSMNKLCISKLLQVIDWDLIPHE